MRFSRQALHPSFASQYRHRCKQPFCPTSPALRQICRRCSLTNPTFSRSYCRYRCRHLSPRRRLPFTFLGSRVLRPERHSQSGPTQARVFHEESWTPLRGVESSPAMRS
jgi:hypothetical protein